MLWRVHNDSKCDMKLKVELETYMSVDELIDSDHKPVIAVCSLQARPACLLVMLFKGQVALFYVTVFQR